LLGDFRSQTTLHREDLNPLDKAEALLKEITEETGIAPDDVPRLLSTVVRRLDYQKRMKQVSELVTCPEGEQEEKLAAFEVSESEKAMQGLPATSPPLEPRPF
jgi:ParB family chromosome partitioning protein